MVDTATVSTVVPDYDTSRWTELTPADGLLLDLRYATANNFVQAPVYPCGRCFLQPAAASALEKVVLELKTKGYRLKLLDCYRPAPAQQKLWDKVPNPDYVAPPAEGSMHTRGVAVDLTVIDTSGREIDMGTPYDFFGPEAHQDYLALPESVLFNRLLLRNAMEAAGFQAIRTEWWHFSLRDAMPPLENWQWPCK